MLLYLNIRVLYIIVDLYLYLFNRQYFKKSWFTFDESYVYKKSSPFNDEGVK